MPYLFIYKNAQTFSIVDVTFVFIVVVIVLANLDNDDITFNCFC